MHEKIFLKRVLTPLWGIQIICLLIFAASSGVVLYAVDDAGLGGYAANIVNTAAAFQLAFSVFTIVLIIVEIILTATHRMGPVVNIVMQCIKSAIWTTFFIIVLKGVIQSQTSGLAVIMVLVLFLSCIAQLIYAAVIVHRHRKGTLHRGSYALTSGGAPQSTAYLTPYNAPPVGTYMPSTPAATNPYSAPYPESAETAYKPYKPAGAANSYYGGNAHSNAFEMQGPATRY